MSLANRQRRYAAGRAYRDTPVVREDANLAIDSKLRGCDVVAVQVND
jgi:hypothetical protein